MKTFPQASEVRDAMDGNQLRMMRLPSGWRKLATVAAVSLLGTGLLAGTAVDAAAIRNHKLQDSSIHAAAVSSRLSWREFLSGGVSLWSTTPAPAFPSNIHLASANGLLVETPFVDYLLWRRSLDPARFDLHHRNIAPELAQLLTAPMATSPASIIVPPTSLNPQPQGLVVPEPSTLMIALLTFGSGFAWLQRSRRDSSVSNEQPR